MKRIFIVLFLTILTAPAAFSQSRYIPLGMNGTVTNVSSTFGSSDFRSAQVAAGYGVGGRLDLNLEGGVLVEELDGITEVIPNFSFGFKMVMIKQQRAVPFSLVAGIRVGFASALPENREIFGTNFGFNMLVCRDFWIREKFLIGINGAFIYDRYRFDITNNSTDPATVSESRLHHLRFGPALDVGIRYFEDNLLVLRGDFLWDQEGSFTTRVNLILVIPTTR